ncbi:MAG TPA: DUF4215 domain-containing protein [bacterium]|nr:DUF4215 domain-containing protein [bacterium]
MKVLFFIIFALFVLVSCDTKKTGAGTDNESVIDDDTATLTDDDSTTDSEDTDTVTDSDEIVTDSDEISDSDIFTLPVCGNGKIEGSEVCDGDTKNCVDIDAERYLEGTATCADDCTEYDTRTCVRACTDGQTRCLVNVLQECSSKEWFDKEDCEDLYCLPKDGTSRYQRVYECRELGTDNKCSVVLACAMTCAGDADCLIGCEASSTEAAKGYYEALMACGESPCAEDFTTTCLRNACPEEYQACRNDPGVICGNGFIEGTEECDDGNISVLDGCSTECKNETPGTCNNGTIESGEQCEDGNIENGDGCSDSCRLEFGDRFDTEGPNYAGNAVLILNISPFSDNMSTTGTLPAVPVLKNISVTPATSATGLNDLFINPHFKIPAGLTNDDLYEPKVVFLPKVGDTQSFYKVNAAGTGYEQVTATLLKIGAHVQIWSDETDFATGSELDDMADEFDSVIYPLVTTKFATPSDINADGTITLLFTDLGMSIAGYFSPGDLYAKSMYPQSNERDMIFVSTRVALTNKGAYAVIAHEFQHLCYNNQNAIIEDDAQGINDNENIWINEGMSMTAMHLYNGIQSDWISAYNQSTSVSSGQALTYWNDSDSSDVYGNYALSYLFFEYLRIQGDNKTEMFKEIVSNEKNNYLCVEDAIRKYAGEGLSFADFYTNFRIALFLNDDTGIFGFEGESGFALNQKFYTGTAAVNLRGTGALLREIDGSITEPADKGPLTRYIGITTEE